MLCAWSQEWGWSERTKLFSPRCCEAARRGARRVRLQTPVSFTYALRMYSTIRGVTRNSIGAPMAGSSDTRASRAHGRARRPDRPCGTLQVCGPATRPVRR